MAGCSFFCPAYDQSKECILTFGQALETFPDDKECRLSYSPLGFKHSSNTYQHNFLSGQTLALANVVTRSKLNTTSTTPSPQLPPLPRQHNHTPNPENEAVLPTDPTTTSEQQFFSTLPSKSPSIKDIPFPHHASPIKYPLDDNGQPMAFFPDHSPTTDSTTSNETTPTLTLSQQKELTQQIIQELKTNGEITPTFLSKLLPPTFTNTTTLTDRPSVGLF